MRSNLIRTQFIALLIVGVAFSALGQIDRGARESVNLNTWSQLLAEPNGDPVRQRSGVHSDGSPFSYEEWMPAAIHLSNGKVLENVLVRLNLVAQEIHYMSEAYGKEMVAYGGTVKELFVAEPRDNQMITRKYSFKKLDGTKSYLCEHLVEGKATLLRSTVKRELTDKAYNSATVNIIFQEDTDYYVQTDAGFAKVNKRKSNLAELLPGKSAELQAFIAQKKLKLKSEEQMAELVTYYNSLQ
ncbi:MAG TPA: hypothetical protein DCE81_14255 [Cytophagales bacterium]|nr:hypothetical protein [Cyclobacteriaceae bacterium]HAC26070.1 hypothetical protein [Cytophagales bacterium]